MDDFDSIPDAPEPPRHPLHDLVVDCAKALGGSFDHLWCHMVNGYRQGSVRLGELADIEAAGRTDDDVYRVLLVRLHDAMVGARVAVPMLEDKLLPLIQRARHASPDAIYPSAALLLQRGIESERKAGS